MKMWKRNNITIRPVDNPDNLSTVESTQKHGFSTTEKGLLTANPEALVSSGASQKRFNMYTKHNRRESVQIKQIKALCTNPHTLLRRLRYLYINNLLNCPVENK